MDDDTLDLYEEIWALEAKVSAQWLAIEALTIMMISVIGETAYTKELKSRERIIGLREFTSPNERWDDIKKEFHSIMDIPPRSD